MSVVARLEVIPAREGSMSDAVASAVEALEAFDVNYETTPTDTVVEADDAAEVFAAAEAAHRSVSAERVITSLELDDHRARTRPRRERVASVERHLGHPAKRERQKSVEGGDPGTAEPGSRRSPSEPDLYGGPRRSRAPEGGTASTPDPGAQTNRGRRTESRYLRTSPPRSD